MRILVLGGYGGTGKLFCRYLLQQTDANVIVAGRDQQEAKAWSEQLKLEFPPGRVADRCVDAAEPESLRAAFRDIDFVLVAATTTQYAKSIAEAALEACIDYLDIYYRQDVYPELEALQPRIEEAGQCFITQAGFHPGLPAAYIRKGAGYFDAYERAIVAFAMSARIEKPESVYELVDALADYKADIYEDGQWRRATYRDAVKIDFGARFGLKSCVPMDMIEIRDMPNLCRLRNVGVYAAGFNWFVDYVVFPLILLSQTIRKGALRHFWARALIWGMNNLSRSEEGVVFLLRAEGGKDGKPREVVIRSEHGSAYEFTVIPVIACLKQYLDGSIRKPGLWMLGEIVDPDRMLDDMEKMGVKNVTQVMDDTSGPEHA